MQNTKAPRHTVERVVRVINVLLANSKNVDLMLPNESLGCDERGVLDHFVHVLASLEGRKQHAMGQSARKHLMIRLSPLSSTNATDHSVKFLTATLL